MELKNGIRYDFLLALRYERKVGMMPVDVESLKEVTLAVQTLAESTRQTARPAAPGSRKKFRPPMIPARTPFASGMFLALLSGVLLALAMPPFDQAWLMWIGLVPLLRAIHQQPHRVVGYGYATGLIFFTSFWHSVLPWGIDVLLAVCLSLPLFFVVVLSLWAWLAPAMRSTAGRWLLLPLVWVSVEYLVTEWLHMPVTFIAVTQTTVPEALQSAAWLGPYGVSVLVILVNLVVTDLALGSRSTARRRWLPHAFILLLAAANLLVGRLMVNRAPAVSSDADTVDVTLLQPAAETRLYQRRWGGPAESGEFITSAFELTRNLTARASHRAALIVWPEGGNGFYNLRIPWIRHGIAQLATAQQAFLAMSSLDLSEEGLEYNSLFWVDPQGRLSGRYDKLLLVPVGEAGMAAGQAPKVLPAPFGGVGPMICAESNFPAFARHLTQRAATILLISSSGASFRNSSLPLAHARMAILRAIESRRPVILSANMGPSMLIDPQGRILARSPLGERTRLSGSVMPHTSRSFYHRVGFAVPIIVTLVLLGLIARRWNSGTATDFLVRNRWLSPVTCGAALIICSVVSAAVSAGSLLMVNRMLAKPLAPGSALAAFATPLPRATGLSGAAFRQATAVTCGSAALAYLLSAMGYQATEHTINPLVGVTQQGTTLYDLKRAAERMGFDAWGERQNYAALRELAKPVIAHVRDDHYVVVTRADADTVDCFDPAFGRHVRLARPVFESAWRGVVLLVRPQPMPIELGHTEPVT